MISYIDIKIHTIDKISNKWDVEDANCYELVE